MSESARAAQDAEAFMRRALELARQGWGHTAPNPMVGAVVVRDGRIVGEGAHVRFGADHAEIIALKAAGDMARGATLYVTLEPCRHHGKTAPCTDAILSAGVARVVMATTDPTPVAGGGAAQLGTAGVVVTSGLCERDARELNAPFFHQARSDVPWTTLKMAVSIETAIADERGSTSWLTGAEARAEVHRLRAGNDAVAVGIGTVLADDPLLTVRDASAPRRPPARVVFDRRLRLPLQSKLVFTARDAPVIVLTADPTVPHAAALRDAGVHVVGMDSLREGFRRLRGTGIRSLLVEGGATIANAVLAEKLAQRLVIFQAPVALGARGLHAFDGALPETLGALERYPVLERRTLGPDVMTTYALADL